MAGKFEIDKDKAGEFRFRLKASNGQVIGTSQTYASESSCRNGMKSVATQSADAAVDDQT